MGHLSSNSRPLVHEVHPKTRCRCIECCLIGWVLLRLGARKTGGFLVAAGFLVLLVFSSPWVSTSLNRSLEHAYSPTIAEKAPVAEAIVVLGGGVDVPLSPRVSEELNASGDRVLYTARLYRAGRAPWVFVTGGNVFTQSEQVESESFYMSRLLREWGVHPDRIVTEDSSRNTRENAILTKKLLEEKGIKTILLVTSAFHMPRALATFRGVGINAIPAPTDFRIVNYTQPVLLDFLPSAGALAGSTAALREYLGILVYGLRGWLTTEDIFNY